VPAIFGNLESFLEEPAHIVSRASAEMFSGQVEMLKGHAAAGRESLSKVTQWELTVWTASCYI